MDEQNEEIKNEFESQSEISGEAKDSSSTISYEIKSTETQPTQAQQTQTYANQTQLAKPGTNGKAIASMVLGIIGILMVFTYVFSFVSVILGIVGLILGISANKKQRSGIAIAGIVTSAISLGFGLLEAISCVGLAILISKRIKEVPQWIENMEDFNFGPFQQYFENIENSLTI